ncbi:hypothetical protein RRG08_048926 [Elysia crispata]|uniref:DUF19 domain-containing protein n=1 Tax=Elysia crispata TaxID=231223 RepID=A0AAE1E1I0_9GAST|nr:hypothetical protein RRG08_048926 [Elysia crispata]
MKTSKNSAVVPLSLVAIALASCLIQVCISNACSKTRLCVTNVYFGPNGVWSFLFMKTFPTSQAEWDQVWMNICDSIQNTTECLDNQNCTEEFLKSKITVAKLTAHGLCADNNRAYYRDLWSREPQCIANESMDLADWNVYQCFEAANLSNIDVMDSTTKCRALNQFKICDVKFFSVNCGDILRWMVEFSWSNVIHVQFNECYDEMFPNGVTPVSA